MAPSNESKGNEVHLNTISLLKRSFHTLSLTLLTLLLPLSFLLISKLASSPSISIPPSSCVILHLVVSSVSVSSLLHSLTGLLPRPHLTFAWVTVCAFQICLTLGIEAAISEGIKRPVLLSETSRLILVERAVFFLGLYDTMLHWMKVFVKPVVDDTVYGEVGVEEGRAGRFAIGAAFGGLWMWLLRDEIEPLVVAAGDGGWVAGFAGVDEFVVWLVSYSSVVTGMVKVVEIVLCVGSYLFFRLCCGGETDEVVPVPAHDCRNDEVVLLL